MLSPPTKKTRINSKLTENHLDIGTAIRARRLQLNMTLKEVSEKAGLSVGFLSQVERNLTAPSLSSLVTLSNALGVGVEYFLSTPKGAGLVTRQDSREYFSVADSAIKYARLTHEFPGSQLTGTISRIPSGWISEQVSHEGEEMIFLLSGTLFTRIGDEEYDLNPGDCLHFRSTILHQWGNRGDGDSEVLTVNSPALFSTTGEQRP